MNTYTYAVSDAAKRCSDIINMHAVVGSWGKWVAIRLSDGGSDNVLYDSKEDAAKHQGINTDYCAYMVVPPKGMSPEDSQLKLDQYRAYYDYGWNMVDPTPMPPVKREDAYRQLAILRRKSMR